jgi:hypothetical protein
MNPIAQPLEATSVSIFLILATRFGILLILLGLLSYGIYCLVKPASMEQSSTPNRFGTLRSLYLYLAAFVGLAMIVIATVDLLTIFLKTTIFTQADMQNPVVVDIGCDDASQAASTSVKANCEKRYQRNLADNQENLHVSRHGSYARDISFLIVALPLFGYHVRLARKKESTSL